MSVALWKAAVPVELGGGERHMPAYSDLGQVGVLELLQQKPLQQKTHVRHLVSAQDTDVRSGCLLSAVFSRCLRHA